ncbi:MAG: WD40 repeat domain-containing protein [Planctomycetia bacterium]|nr:WD40 repeat domain-containing protein [Planctomycetia bacterium]
MTLRLLRLPVLSALLFLTLPVQAADEDELPKGAKLRLGTDRFAFRIGPAVGLLPPDYKTLVMADGAGIRQFDVATGKPLDKQNSPLFSAGGHMLVSADGKRAMAVRGGGALNVWDVTAKKTIQTLKPPQGFSNALSTGGIIAVMSGDGKRVAQGGVRNGKAEVIVWDVDNAGIITQIPPGHNGMALPTLSHDGKLLATRNPQPIPGPVPGKANEVRTIQVWDVEENKELFQAPYTPTSYRGSTVMFSPDGSLLAASSADGPIDLWDVKTGKPKTTLLGRSGQGLRLAFSADSKTLAAVSTDGSIQKWSIADGKEILTVEGPREVTPYAQGLAFVDKERVIAWGASGSVAVVWDSSGKILSPHSEHTAAIKSIGFADGGKQVVTAGLDGRIVKWNAATGKSVGSIQLRPSRASGYTQSNIQVNISPDATRAVSTGNLVFDLSTGAELFIVPRGSTSGFSNRITPSADLKHAITFATSFDAKKMSVCTVWDLVARKRLIELELPLTTISFQSAAAVSPSGERLVIARYSPREAGGMQTLIVTGWDLKTGKKLGEAEDVNARGNLSVVAASESSAIVTSGGRLRIFDFETGRGGDEIETNGRGELGGAVVFSPDGKRFAFGVADEKFVHGVRVYDWPSGKAIHTFTGHRDMVSALAFSPDGKTLASGSYDTTVLLWDMSAIEK